MNCHPKIDQAACYLEIKCLSQDDLSDTGYENDSDRSSFCGDKAPRTQNRSNMVEYFQMMRDFCDSQADNEKIEFQTQSRSLSANLEFTHSGIDLVNKSKKVKFELDSDLSNALSSSSNERLSLNMQSISMTKIDFTKLRQSKGSDTEDWPQVGQKAPIVHQRGSQHYEFSITDDMKQGFEQSHTLAKLELADEKLEKKVEPYVGRLIKAVSFKAPRDNSAVSTDVESGHGSPASRSGLQNTSFKAAVSSYKWQNLNQEVDMSDYDEEDEECF